MPNYQTPGVYVEEVSTLPPSVASVATAIPAFIGYTETALAGDGTTDLTNVPTRISSLVDYETYFGGAANETNITATVADDGTVTATAPVTPSVFIMHPQMQLYFANGGGPCYIVSVGNYSTVPNDNTTYVTGLNAVALEDEPTLIVFPDAAVALDSTNLYALYQQALSQCNDLQDRFVIMDVIHDTDASISASDFRSTIGTNYLNYGAAYYPYLQTSISYTYRDDEVSTTGISPTQSYVYYSDADNNGIKVTSDTNSDQVAIALSGAADSDPDFSISGAGPYTLTITLPSAGATPVAIRNAWNTWKTDAANTSYTFEVDTDGDGSTDVTAVVNATTLDRVESNQFVYQSDSNGIEVLYKGGYDDATVTITLGASTSFSVADRAITITVVSGTFPSTIRAAWDEWKTDTDNDPGYFEVNIAGDGTTAVSTPATNEAINTVDTSVTLEDLNYLNNSAYHNVVSAIDALTITPLPPSAAMAGVYARVDNDRGVWKAPANVSLNYVTAPDVKISNANQETLNVDTTAGKSINAIRSFFGKGTLVWGARTLAGNDNEWRYISTRRLFITVEESIKKATSWVVFESNTANTWVKVKAQIENYLNGLWRDGALAGATPGEAFYVNVGLGATMSSDDILNGIMNIEIGIAAVRPAEFIILKFYHKLQES